MPTPESSDSIKDPSLRQFWQHLRTDGGASLYTQRNYEQTLTEFYRWFEKERQHAPNWTSLQRDDFRAYLRFLGRNNLSRAAIQLRFSALRSFYKFLIRRGTVEVSPIKNISLPKLEKRLPRFLTVKQMLDLLEAPLQDLGRTQKASEQPVEPAPFLLDVAILETI